MVEMDNWISIPWLLDDVSMVHSTMYTDSELVMQGTGAGIRRNQSGWRAMRAYTKNVDLKY